MTDDLAYTPAAQLAEMIRRKQISPVEVMAGVLARIERLNPRVNAFAHLAAGPAMEAARKAEAALTGGGR
ncbi:MAG: amidase, partial [Acetobacteraceae bacterium]